MNLREGIACFAAAAGVLLAVGFYRRAAEAERNSEAAKQDMSRKIKDLQGRMKEAAERAAETPAPVPAEASLPQVAEKPVEKKAEEVAPPAPAAPVQAISSGHLKVLMNSPSLKMARRRAAVAGVEERYGDLLTSWGLQGDVRQRMLEALIERDMAKTSITMDIMHSGAPAEEIMVKVQEAQRQADEEFSRKLTPAELASFNEYEQGIPDRMMRKETDREIGELGVDSARAPALRDILLGEKRRESEESARSLADYQATAAGTPGQTDRLGAIEAMVKAKRASNERILTQARPMLSDAEYQTLKDQREAGIAPLELALQFANLNQEGAAAK